MGTWSLLVAFLGAPIVWALHLGVSYFLVALDCETDWNGGRDGVMVATAICIPAALAAGAFAWRGWQRMRARAAPGELLDPWGIRGFLALSGALLAVLFAGAIVLAGISPVFLPMCS